MKNISDFDQPNNGVQSDTLLIGLHGYTGNGDAYLQAIEANTPLFDDVSVVCPTSIFQDSSGNSDWPLDAGDMRSTWFLAGIIQDLIQNYGIDPNKIYLNGHSKGATQDYRLASNFPNLFQAIIVSAGYFPDPTSNITCPVKHIHGTRDGEDPQAVAGVPLSGVEPLSFPKIINGGADLTLIRVEGAGHTIGTGAPDEIGLDDLPTLNSKLRTETVGSIVRRNIP